MKKVTKLVYAALFSALALVLGLVQIPTPFQFYLALDASEVVVLVAGNYFGFGVMAITIILRSLLRFAFGISTGAAFVGELAAIISSFIFGGIFLLIKKVSKDNEKTYKTNILITLILLILSIPFVLYSVKAINNPDVENGNWLILALVTVYLPIVFFILFNIFKKDFCKKNSNKILEATSAILINTVIMTLLNFLFITPTNFNGGVPATFIKMLAKYPMNIYVYTFILPLIPFNILKGVLSLIIFFMLEKTMNIVVAKNK